MKPADQARLTEAVEMAWQIAAEEATHAGYAAIEPLHLFIGTLSIPKLFEPGHPENARVRSGAVEQIRSEWQPISQVLSAAKADPIRLRRSARKLLGHGTASGRSPERIGRSEASRRIFSSAEQMASRASTEVNLVHLFRSLVDFPEAPFEGLLKSESVDSVQLKSALAAVAPQPLEESQQVSMSIDASVAPFDDSAAAALAAKRLRLFYELPLQFGAEAGVCALLNKIVDKMLFAVPHAGRAALLVRDRKTGELLLQAHRPVGEPAASMTLAERVVTARQGLIWNRTSGDTSPSLAEYASETGMYAPLLWQGRVLGVMCVESRKVGHAFEKEDLRLLVAIAHHAAMAIAAHQLQEDLQQKSTVLERLLTNFSPRIRRRLLEKAANGNLSLGGEKSEVTILFADIRGFTQLIAKMATEDVVEMLNHYFSALVEIIFRNDGTVDKFIGDAILAVFGSPEADPAHHEKALRAAQEMQCAMSELNRVRSAEGQPVCEIGVGLHCGEVLHGFVGTPDRMEFTVVGGPVNRAARFCAVAKPGEILMSPELHQRVWKLATVEPCSIETKHEGEFSAYRIRRCGTPPLPQEKGKNEIS
jgi:adenylate cyclase